MIKAKGTVTLAADVRGSGAITVAKANGTLTISLDPSALGPTSGTDNIKVIAWNSITGELSLTDLADLVNP